MKKSSLVLVTVGVIVLLLFFGRLYFSEADFSLQNPAWNGLSGISGANARPLYDLTDLGAVSSSDTFLVMSPLRDYTAAESAQVAAFVQRGGKLVVMDDFGNSSSLLTAIGSPITIDPVPICEYDNYHVNHSFPLVRQFNPSRETTNVSQLVFNHPASLVVTGDAYPLAMTSDKGYQDRNDNTRLDGDEHMGTFIMAARAEYGLGEIVVVSDPDLLINGMTDIGDNRQFMANVLTGITWVDVSHGTGITPAGAAYYAVKYDLRAQLAIAILAFAAGLLYLGRRDITEFIRRKLLRI